jgi:hypothetical protein
MLPISYIVKEQTSSANALSMTREVCVKNREKSVLVKILRFSSSLSGGAFATDWP